MKKYGLVPLLSLSSISHANSQTTPDVDEYNKSALENTKKLDAAKSETAEAIYSLTTENIKKIEQIINKIENIKAKTETKPEELQAAQPALQIELSLLQAKLQADVLKLQSLAMIQAKNTKTKDEIREEEEQNKHQAIAKKLKEKLENSNVRL
uniref:VirB5 n=1 Tax=Bartonella sp. A554 TaxID=1263600 RepID=K9MYU4_9HYPH|nr:VirB5 [Bartonella sp. A554]